jgi:26S proteasome regulatory subunit N7
MIILMFSLIAQPFYKTVGVSDLLRKDPFVEIHEQFYHKEMRLRAYTQYLESYRSVSLGAMAKSFGVRPEFLDADLARFIASGRLSCRIDKVGGAVETRRPDSTNAQYQAIIRKGDALLNRIQKLSRVIEM